jgi:hypothetical protein
VTEPAETSPASESPHASEAYLNVVSAARLKAISMIKCSFERTDKYEPMNVSLAFGWDVAHFEMKEDIAIAVFEYRVEAKKDELQALNASTSFLVVYDGLDGMNEDAVKSFVTGVGLFAAFPYFRNWLSQLSWTANLELPILPILKAGPGGRPSV